MVASMVRCSGRRHDIVQMGGHLWYEARQGGGSVFAFGLSLQPSSGRASEAGQRWSAARPRAADLGQRDT